jgi:hypothetical protein
VWLADEALREPLTDAFVAAADAYLSRVVPGQQRVLAERLEIWASVHKGCSSSRWRVNAYAALSGVLHVRATAGGSRLRFHDPRGQVPPFNTQIIHQPVEGELLLYPPWLPLEVTANCFAEHATPLISIYFNYVPRATRITLRPRRAPHPSCAH